VTTPSEEQLIAEAYAALRPVRRRYCPLKPTPRQEVFLRFPNKEAFHGGGAGSGKSVTLLIAALQYADVPGYHALLLRPSIAELQLPGGLIQLSHDWLGPTHAQWLSEQRQWRFPSSATLTFGYLDTLNDVRRYLGTSYSFLGFDELTSFAETSYLSMFRVLRQPTGTAAHQHGAAPDGTRLPDVPQRIRSASNPGGPGHSWVRTRFVDPASRAPGVTYLSARPTDNPHLDLTAYLDTLNHLPRAQRERLINAHPQRPRQHRAPRRRHRQSRRPRRHDRDRTRTRRRRRQPRRALQAPNPPPLHRLHPTSHRQQTHPRKPRRSRR
jgi:hypothetical protein